MLSPALRILLAPRGAQRYRQPTGVPTLPVKLTGVMPTRAIVDTTAVEAFKNASQFTYDPTIIDVANSSALTTALRTTTSGSHIRLTADITMDPLDLRFTDASQGSGFLGKLIDANGHSLILRATGPDLTSQTYTQDGTYSNVWNTTLTLSGSAALQRVFRTDVLDSEGEPTPAVKNTTSKASLSATSGFAFYVSGTALSIKLADDSSVEAFKANLKGLYTGAAATSRILVYGAALCLWANGGSIKLDGVQITMIDGSSRLPMIYMQGVRQVYAVGKGADLTQCGRYVAQDCLIYGSQADGANGFATSAVSKGLIQTVNCRFVRNGDTRTFAADGTLQGVSAHGGVDHVSFGTEFSLNNGQGVADTCDNSQSDVSWLVGCRVTGGESASANLGFGSAATSASRTAFLDSVALSSAPAAGDLAIATNGVVNVHRTMLGVISGGSVATYTPGTV